ncbi:MULTISPECIES: SNF2-related protein [unclassified Rickettsia]|uniref:SNF2-related protein n=1 Tax=unclassified Rickettsia TaxID=114295 RepID=UPI003132BDA9
MLKIAYRDKDRKALIGWEEIDYAQPWLEPIKRLIFDNSDKAQQEGGYQLSLPWWTFISLRSQFGQLLKGYEIQIGENLEIETKAELLLRQSTQNNHDYQKAKELYAVKIEDLLSKLKEVGFSRLLTTQQERNICKIAALPAAATFSVPGAGKTTEALATFFFKATSDEGLLVIAPKNAFGAWDEQLEACMPNIYKNFTRLRGGTDKINRLLESRPRFMLITYQQLPRVRELIAGYLSRYKTHVFLDESHRIKSGLEKQTPQTILSIAHLPVGKLIMSGTPMPQAVEDLIPQFTFLYPEIPVTGNNVIELIKPIYVRTNKAELGLPPVTRVVRKLHMAPVQYELYNLMKFEVSREAATALNNGTKQALRILGRSVAKLLQFVSNPALLSREIGFVHSNLLQAVLAEGDGPKLKYVLKRARELVRNNQKVLIWSSFVKNVEYIAQRLVDLGAVYIHGGVDAGDEDDDETREGKIKLFHDDPNVKIMVANPAAASEGVSLHKICHHAIYLDRTFNAAHYLQSEDRIHRLGLSPNEQTNIEIVECTGTIDETVRERLNFKVGKMAEALEDSSLKIDPIPIDPISTDDPEDYVIGLLPEDIEALLRDFKKKNF